MAIPEFKIINLKELTAVQLTIPPYQRPYKWTEKNVVHLLDDIFEWVITGNKRYRIGNIIIHCEPNNPKGKNVVDGQQRITTISLLLKHLEPDFEKLFLKEEFKHKTSKKNIVTNNRIIGEWLKTKFGADGDKKKDFHLRILEKC
jgi:uncharacterized protein with ParB-like and HNH nuclease domain